MTRSFKKISLLLLAMISSATVTMAQESSAGVVQRRSGGQRQRANQAAGPQVTQRMQSFYEDAGKNITDADRQWMRVIYRHIDLDKEKNAPLYFPEENIDGQENLFRIIMRLLANNQIAAYEYLDGREIFNDQYRVKVKDVLDRFHIIHTDAKGSTEKNPKFTIEESDVPTNEVLSYYVIERWEFDSRSNRMKTVVEAICPVLHRSGDFGGEAVRYPMFWIKFKDIRPWLAQQTIFVSDDNNIPSCTYDDYFNLTMYEGDIYKTRNLRNKSMAQLYPDADDLKKAQDSIQNRLTKWEDKLWVPDREEVIAAADKKRDQAESKTDDNEVVATDGAPVVGSDDQSATEKKSSRRSTKRSTKKEKKNKPKQSKVKESKASKSSSAVRSVRRRKN
ncbi:MAG: gliding motility protein GldN [Muribaculaceae bacterium]|nr:gliding motility protein GldN [Muribaculaceae bacterium]